MRVVFEASQSPPALTEATPAAANSLHDRSMGDLIRAVRSLSDSQIEQIAAHQRSRGMRFGEAAVDLNLASDDDVVWALSQQFHYPYAPSASEHRNPELVVARDPFSAPAEIIRDLCSQLTLGMAQTGEPRAALSVVSADTGDGKTFLAANLAVAFSQVGLRTLLIDADMRTPRLHEVFALDSANGLSAVLAGRSNGPTIQPVPDLPSLFVMPVGMVPPNPLELLQRSAFSLLLRELLGKFDQVIVDTPALTRGADARVIAARCGSAVAVGRKGRSRLSAMSRMIALLGQNRTRVKGVVVNEH